MPNAIARLREHPTGFWFIFWGELAERASFYGMRTVLALYMITVLGFAEADGAAVMHTFIAACYLAPLLGGFIADRWLGRYRTILYFSGPYVLGHIILGGWQSRTGLAIALTLLALGSGSIKPNTSTLMGQMYEAQKKDFLLTEAFSYFYAAINIGAAIATLALPVVRDRVAATSTIERGYAVALTIPAALMVFAFFFFALGKRFYPQENVRSLPPKTAEQREAEWKTLGRIAGLFALIAIFWFVYDQSASTWIYFANKRMNLHVIGDLSTTADQIQGLNPVLIVVLTPFFNWLWNFLKERRGGVDVPDTRKMLIGFIIVIACMATMSVAGFLSESGPVTVWWMIVATFVITLSELCISVVGLEFAYKVAAPGTKSVVTAAFLFTVFGGDFIAGLFDKGLWGKISPGAFFALQTGIMVVAGAVFFGVARRFEQSDRSEAPSSVAVHA
jgi:POT family proton-dependent oligopeptide transporter